MISLEQGLANYIAHGTNLANCLFAFGFIMYELRTVFIFLNGYTLNGYISTYTLSLILPDPSNQKRDLAPQGKVNE